MAGLDPGHPRLSAALAGPWTLGSSPRATYAASYIRFTALATAFSAAMVTLASVAAP